MNENSLNTSMSEVLQRFYMIVDHPFPIDSKSSLGKMIGHVRNTLFDQLSVNSSSLSLPVQPGIPILNFTENNEIVQDLLNKRIILETDLYNKPYSSEVVSNKVSFHKQFYDVEFIPKTVFSVDETKDLQFPIIAKPANGKSAKGIKKFDSFEDLKTSNETFDVFSEMISIKKEYRCFCFGSLILSIDERIKLPNSKDFLSDSNTTTEFFYKNIDLKKYKLHSKLLQIVKKSKDYTGLDFFSVDFAETPTEELFVIEMNSRTGMGVEKMVDLYKVIYNDFYNKRIDSSIETKLDFLKAEWKELYKKEKEVKLNECTIVAGSLNNSMFLFKNRDRSFTPDNVIVREKYKGVEIVYYTDQTGWIEGMNEYGVGFVFAQLTEKHVAGYKPSWKISDEPKNKKFYKFFDNIKNVLTAQTAKQAVEFIEKSKKSGSFLVGDRSCITEMEVFKGEIKKRELEFNDSYCIKTNHGELIPEAGHQESSDSIKRASSSIRKHQAEVQLLGIQDPLEIPSRMKFQMFDTNSSLNTFRTDSEEYTISQCLMNLSNLEFYFFHDKHTADTLNIEDDLKNYKIKIVSKEL